MDYAESLILARKSLSKIEELLLNCGDADREERALREALQCRVHVDFLVLAIANKVSEELPTRRPPRLD